MNHSLEIPIGDAIGIVELFLSRRKSNGRGIKKPTGVLLHGPVGVGKSALMNKLASSRGERLVDIRASMFDPTDLKGIPIKTDEDQVRWVVSTFMPASCSKTNNLGKDFYKTFRLNSPNVKNIMVHGWNPQGEEVLFYNDHDFPDTEGLKVETEYDANGVTVNLSGVPDDVVRIEVAEKCFVFLDEITTADPSVQNVCLQLVLDRKINEYDLPTGCPVVAAGNRESDGAFVAPMSHALANRVAHLIIRPDSNGFIEYGIKNGLRPEIIGFVKTFPNVIMEGYDPDSLGDGKYGFPTSRTMEMVSDILDTDMDTNTRFMMTSALIGAKWAEMLEGYLQVFARFPDPMLVLTGKKPEIDSDIGPAEVFGFLISILQNLENAYISTDKNDPEAMERWGEMRDNVLQYLPDNFSREANHYALSSFVTSSNIKKIHLTIINGKVSKVAEEFSKNTAGVLTKLLEMKAASSS